MNNQLEKLYNNYWNKVDSEYLNYLQYHSNGEHTPTNPLLIHLDNEESYRNADIRVMFFGQETNDWEGIWGSKSIKDLFYTYNYFYNLGNCYSYGGQFWNAIADYKRTINMKYPNKNIAYTWNNILKVGKAYSKGASNENIINIEKQHFPVINKEIEILKPDIIIFFTGPNYDKYIKREFKEPDFATVYNWPSLGMVKICSNALPERTIRTYHPGYLYRKGKGYYNEVKSCILSLI